ncbi:MAG: sensor histidine kinase [Lachnospiraceae bacterium]|nr:sensor histidine kinase [Lachnospiraceae bacterium]
MPELSVFLPVFCYIYFYRQQYLLPFLYCSLILVYCSLSQSYVNLLSFSLIALSFYLSYQNRIRTQLQQTTKELRDNSVEKEMLLKRHNEQLMESQNDQIYIATLKERNRIAREIHDSVGHLLSRSILQVGALLAICKDEILLSHLTALKETLNNAMDSIRNSVHDLHDESIDLYEAMNSLVGSFTFCPVQFDCQISRNISKEVKYCFLAITKEALNNTIKHSNASRLSIAVKELPGFYQLLIEDNGTTASASAPAQTDGIGLSNMTDRVHAIHGIIHINAQKGFRIFVSIPKEPVS